MNVFVTGATGLIGRALCGALVGDGHAVTALSRNPRAARVLPAGARPVTGDPAVAGPWLDALAACDACVHLAGEPIAKGRWSAEKKRRILESRVRSTAIVAGAIRARGPRVLVSASAVGLYGSRGDEVLDEGAAPGQGFLAEVASAWEEAARPAGARARLVLLRTGVVFSMRGGALPKLARPFRMFVGGPLGRGDAWLPWIHIADVVGLVRLALQDARVIGPLNASAPEPVRNRDLARNLGRVLHRPSAFPTSERMLRLGLGEKADAILASQRVVPRRALELGYRFRFPTIEGALRDLIG